MKKTILTAAIFAVAGFGPAVAGGVFSSGIQQGEAPVSIIDPQSRAHYQDNATTDSASLLRVQPAAERLQAGERDREWSNDWSISNLEIYR